MLKDFFSKGIKYTQSMINDKKESIKAIKALGIDNCAVNLDFMMMKGIFG